MKMQTKIILSIEDIKALQHTAYIMSKVSTLVDRNLFGVRDLVAIAGIASGVRVDENLFDNMAGVSAILADMIEGEKDDEQD